MEKTGQRTRDCDTNHINVYMYTRVMNYMIVHHTSCRSPAGAALPGMEYLDTDGSS